MNEWEKHEGFMPWIYVDDDIYISVDAYKSVHIHLSKLEDDYAFVDEIWIDKFIERMRLNYYSYLIDRIDRHNFTYDIAFIEVGV